MSNFPLYLAKLTIGLSIVYCFYYLALKQLTFYTWNRYYLLVTTAICVFLPLLDITEIINESYPTITSVTNVIPIITQPILSETSLNQPIEINGPSTSSASISIWQALVYCYIAISIFFLVRLFIQLYSVYRLHKKAILFNSELNIHHINEEIAPFSFGKSIYLNINKHNLSAYHEIILHESIHVKQKHFIDIITSEIICILNWFNPFAWLLRDAIRQNLEFIADNQVVESGVNKKIYQYRLLEVSGVSKYNLVSHFNIHSLKKRIAMMNKSKSKQSSTFRFIFILPILCLLLLSFRTKLEILPILKSGLSKATDLLKAKETVKKNETSFVDTNKPLKKYITLGIVLDEATFQPIAGVTIKEANHQLETKTDARGVYKITITDTSSRVNYNFKMSKKGLPFLADQSGSYTNESEKNETGVIMISSIRTKPINDQKAGLVNSSSYSSTEPTLENLHVCIGKFVKSRENEAVIKLANEKNERIFEVIDNQSFILRANGTVHASMNGISPLILIEGKILTGEELNANYKRSQIKIKSIRADGSEATKQKYSSLYGVFEIELKKAF